MELSTLPTSHISALCVAELLAVIVSPSPSRSPSRSLSPELGAPIWVEGDGDGGCNASVQNNVRGPWSSQKWQRATSAFIWNGNKKFDAQCCFLCTAFSNDLCYSPSVFVQSLPGYTTMTQLIITTSLTFRTVPTLTNVWCSKLVHTRTVITVPFKKYSKSNIL